MTSHVSSHSTGAAESAVGRRQTYPTTVRKSHIPICLVASSGRTAVRASRAWCRLGWWASTVSRPAAMRRATSRPVSRARRVRTASVSPPTGRSVPRNPPPSGRSGGTTTTTSRWRRWWRTSCVSDRRPRDEDARPNPRRGRTRRPPRARDLEPSQNRAPRSTSPRPCSARPYASSTPPGAIPQATTTTRTTTAFATTRARPGRRTYPAKTASGSGSKPATTPPSNRRDGAGASCLPRASSTRASSWTRARRPVRPNVSARTSPVVASPPWTRRNFGSSRRTCRSYASTTTTSRGKTSPRWRPSRRFASSTRARTPCGSSPRSRSRYAARSNRKCRGRFEGRFPLRLYRDWISVSTRWTIGVWRRSPRSPRSND